MFMSYHGNGIKCTLALNLFPPKNIAGPINSLCLKTHPNLNKIPLLNFENKNKDK